jgi:peptidoglycan/LPS O-acetylase OafA/YrhL
VSLWQREKVQALPREIELANAIAGTFIAHEVTLPLPIVTNRNVGDEHLAVLDGWRAVSIILVLATHLLPLGPKAMQLNQATAPMGMALFFTLSGFLITRFLLHHDSVVDFLIRRIFRILPLALVGLIVALTMTGATSDVWFRNLTFSANLPPIALTEIASHYWSLDVEIQFYLGIALVFAVFGARGLYLLPVVCAAVTLHRVWAGAIVDIVTWRRVDEILVGGILALAVDGRLGSLALAALKKLNFPLLLIGFMLSCHPATGPLNYIRPYFAALLVGATLFGIAPPVVIRVLGSRPMAYIAKVSFAVYVIHHILMYTWIGMDEDRLMKYVKRPLLFAATFGLAHLSTFFFEQRCIEFGKRLSRRLVGNMHVHKA